MLAPGSRKRFIENTFPIDLQNHVNYQPKLVMDGIPYVGMGHYHFVIQTRSKPTARWQTNTKIRLTLASAPAKPTVAEQQAPS